MSQMYKAVKEFAGVLISAAVLGLARPASATTYQVTMTGNWTFSPSYLEIQVGDSVTWVNYDDFDCHDSVSTQGYWATGCLEYGQTATLTFPITGTFPYEDSFYYVAGMTGTVVVNAATGPPPPVLTNPVRLPNGTFQFTVSNLVVNTTNILQASTDLVTWTNINTNVATSSSYDYVDNGAPVFKRRFYQAIVLQ